MTKSVRHVVTVVICLCCFLCARIVLAQTESAVAIAELTQPQFNVMGFGDIGYTARDSTDEGGFFVGQAVAHLSASLGQSLSVFGEFTLTARDSEYAASVERLIVKYEFSDLFKLSGGRYHSPIGYWNSAFHHGAWLQTTVSRPEMMKFGSQIVPIHFVGALLEGSLPQNKLGLSYLAGFGNGRHENISQAGDSGDINGENAWMVQINASPQQFFGLKTGIGFYTDRVSPENQPEVDEKTFSAYVVWARESPEVIVEYVHSNHQLTNDGSVSGDVNGWYAQFAYRLGGKYRNWKPYARYESNQIDDSDPLLGNRGLEYEGLILGVRWDFNPYAAVKVEYRNEEFDNGGREDNFRLQVSFVLANI